MLDYFEMERVIEELAKAYPAQCATTWFKVTKNHKPSKEEYRNKVVEYMRQFEYLLATFPQSPETDKLKILVKKSLAREIERVLEGNNNDVERRHKHYVVNSPYDDSIDTIKEVSEQPYSKKPITIADLIKEKKAKKNKDNTIEAKEEEEEEEKQKQMQIRYEDNSVVDKRRRKKKLLMVLD
jgi:ribosomal protein L12E/L44/L45/RPP1/RPP2